MSTLYFKKSGASVLRMLDERIAEISLPGYTKCLLVDFKDEWQVGPPQVGTTTLTTLTPKEGARGDIYLTPFYMFKLGIVPDSLAGDSKYPAGKGGSYAELWRAWAQFRRLDPSGPVAESLDALRSEVQGGVLLVCAADLAAGDLDRALDGLDGMATTDSAAARSARNLLAPADRADRRKVSSVLQAAITGILADAL